MSDSPLLCVVPFLNTMLDAATFHMPVATICAGGVFEAREHMAHLRTGDMLVAGFISADHRDAFPGNDRSDCAHSRDGRPT